MWPRRRETAARLGQLPHDRDGAAGQRATATAPPLQHDWLPPRGLSRSPGERLDGRGNLIRGISKMATARHLEW